MLEPVRAAARLVVFISRSSTYRDAQRDSWTIRALDGEDGQARREDRAAQSPLAPQAADEQGICDDLDVFRGSDARLDRGPSKDQASVLIGLRHHPISKRSELLSSLEAGHAPADVGAIEVSGHDPRLDKPRVRERYAGGERCAENQRAKVSVAMVRQRH